MRESKKPVDPTVGRRLAELRKSRKLPQGAVAKQLGVALSTVKDWEHGRIQLTSGRIRQLARALGYPPSALWQPVGSAVRPVKHADDPGGIEPDALA
jgi:transcriptional regulator with XRE-family HTH domain